MKNEMKLYPGWVFSKENPAFHTKMPHRSQNYISYQLPHTPNSHSHASLPILTNFSLLFDKLFSTVQFSMVLSPFEKPLHKIVHKRGCVDQI